MIASTKVTQIKQLLALGTMSHRKIAKATGVSRSTIGAIASGKRPDYKARSRPHVEYPTPDAPVARCPQCGGMVHLPCWLCHVRKIKARDEAIAEIYKLRLRGIRMRRYVARLRRASGRPSPACSEWPKAG